MREGSPLGLGLLRLELGFMHRMSEFKHLRIKTVLMLKNLTMAFPLRYPEKGEIDAPACSRPQLAMRTRQYSRYSSIYIELWGFFWLVGLFFSEFPLETLHLTPLLDLERL